MYSYDTPLTADSTPELFEIVHSQDVSVLLL
jgi:hypothetical protein